MLVFSRLLIPLTIVLTLFHGAFTSLWGAEETSTVTKAFEQCIREWEQGKFDNSIHIFLKNFQEDYQHSNDQVCQELVRLIQQPRDLRRRAEREALKSEGRDIITEWRVNQARHTLDPAIQAELEALRKGKLEAEEKIIVLQAQLQNLNAHREDSLPACVQEWKEENFLPNNYPNFSQNFTKKYQRPPDQVCQDLFKSMQDFQRTFTGMRPRTSKYRELYQKGQKIISDWKVSQARHTPDPAIQAELEALRKGKLEAKEKIMTLQEQLQHLTAQVEEYRSTAFSALTSPDDPPEMIPPPLPYTLADPFLQQLNYPHQWLKENYQIDFQLSIANTQELQQVHQILLKHGKILQNLKSSAPIRQGKVPITLDQPLIRYLQLPQKIEDVNNDYIMAVLMTLQDTQQIFSKIKQHARHLFNDFGSMAFTLLFQTDLTTLKQALTFEKEVDQRITALINQIESITQGSHIPYQDVTQEILDVFPALYHKTDQFVKSHTTFTHFKAPLSHKFPKIDIENYKSIFQDLFRLFSALSNQAHQNMSEIQKISLQPPEEGPNHHFALSQIQGFAALQDDHPLNVSGTLEKIQDVLNQWSHWRVMQYIQLSAQETECSVDDTTRAIPEFLKRVARSQERIKDAQHHYKRFHEALSGLATFTPKHLLHIAQTLDRTPKNLDALLAYTALHSQHFSTSSTQDFIQDFSNHMLTLSSEKRYQYEEILYDLHRTLHDIADAQPWKKLWPAYQEMVSSIKKLNLNGHGEILKGFESS